MAVGAAAVGLTLLLAGCSSADKPAASASPTPSASPSPSASATSASPSPKPVKASDNLDKVSASGDFGKKPKFSIDAPFAIDKTRTKVLHQGKGPVVQEGASVAVNSVGANGRTGKVFDNSFDRGAPVTFPLAQVVPGFSKGLVGQKQGSRVLVAMPGPDGYDSSGGNPQIGVNVGDTLVFLVDLVDVPLSGPEGSKVPPKPGLPTVTEKGGTPEITVPKSDPPTDLVAQPLIKGDGRKVTANDQITFDYRWVRWSDGQTLEESYSKRPANAALSALLPGMVRGLTGQTLGSRVLLVIPPALAYPSGNASPSVAPGETMVMVVDLLFSQQPQ
jgi:peptidylprolyl isomerase